MSSKNGRSSLRDPTIRVRVRRSAVMLWASRNNVTLKEVARKAACSQSYFSQLLGGTRNPNPHTRARLLRVFKPLRWEELFEESA